MRSTSKEPVKGEVVVVVVDEKDDSDFLSAKQFLECLETEDSPLSHRLPSLDQYKFVKCVRDTGAQHERFCRAHSTSVSGSTDEPVKLRSTHRV